MLRFREIDIHKESARGVEHESAIHIAGDQRGDFARERFVALENSYHGETLGALAMSDIPLYRRTYAPLLMQPMFDGLQTDGPFGGGNAEGTYKAFLVEAIG